MAGNATARPIGDVVRFRSGRDHPEDLAVATSLSEKYGLSVNERPEDGRTSVDPEHGFQVWRRHDLGVYAPIYPMRSTSAEVPMSGAGGESHRLFYKNDMRGTMTRAAGDIAAGVGSRLTAQMDVDLDRAAGDGGDRRLTHYRGFRDRFHGGRNPLRHMTFAPLASVKLRDASLLMHTDRRERAQVLVDVLMNCAPALADEPYDSPSKAITDEQRDDVTRVQLRDVAAGKVYGVRDVLPGVVAKRPNLAPFAEAFTDAAGRVRGTGVLDEDAIASAAEELTAAVEADRFPHAVRARGVSTTILAGEALRLSAVARGAVAAGSAA
jgi:hypothetical protein